MNQSVIKALKMLDFFIEQPELTLSELVKLMGLPKPTVHRLLSSLEAVGFLVKVKQSSHDVRYRMGLKLLELGSNVKEQLDYRKIALPHMEELNKELNEAVHLAVLDGYEAVYVEKVESGRDIRLYNRVGKRSHLLGGSAPKVLFAYLSEEQLHEALETIDFQKFTENKFQGHTISWSEQLHEALEIMDFQKFTKNTITDKESLITELKKIKFQGYATGWSEQNPDAIGMSFPIMDRNGQVVASLGISTSLTRFMQHGEEVIKEETKKTAENISRDLGYRF